MEIMLFSDKNSTKRTIFLFYNTRKCYICRQNHTCNKRVHTKLVFDKFGKLLVNN